MEDGLELLNEKALKVFWLY